MKRRKRLIVDVPLLAKAMRITGRNQSDTVNEALARLLENSALAEGLEQLHGAFPSHPDHEAVLSGRRR
ncbi:MAG: hypothetical protein WKG32_09385 [Gemmatimonadaceae bacterium]